MSTPYIPEWIDEEMDSSSDPLFLLLAREGSFDEAHQTIMFQRAETAQVVTRALIERPAEHEQYTSAEWLRSRPGPVTITKYPKSH